MEQARRRTWCIVRYQIDTAQLLHKLRANTKHDTAEKPENKGQCLVHGLKAACSPLLSIRETSPNR